MNKEDLNLVAESWLDIEKSFYSKAHLLKIHIREWMLEHGHLPHDYVHVGVIERLLDSASKHVANDDE